MANWLIEMAEAFSSSDGKTKLPKGTLKTISSDKIGSSSYMSPLATKAGREALSKATGIAAHNLRSSLFKITKL